MGSVYHINTQLAVYTAYIPGIYDLGASKNRGTPKWMVYNGNPIKVDDLGVPLFFETPIYCLRLGGYPYHRVPEPE